MVKRLPPMQETQVGSLDWEDPLEKEMATPSSTLAWRIPRMEEPGGYSPWGRKDFGHDWATSLLLSLSPILLTSHLWHHQSVLSVISPFSDSTCNCNHIVGLKLNIRKTKIMASGPITSWQIDGETVTDVILGGSKITADSDRHHEIKRRLLLGRKVWPT